MKWIYLLCIVIIAVNHSVRSQPRPRAKPKGLPPTATKRGSRPKNAPPPRITKNTNNAWKTIPPPPGSSNNNNYNQYNNPNQYNQYGRQNQPPYANQNWQQQQYGQPGYNQYNQGFNGPYNNRFLRPPPNKMNTNNDAYLTIDKHPPVLTRDTGNKNGRKIISSKQKPKAKPTPPPTAPTTFSTDWVDFTTVDAMTTTEPTTTTPTTTTTKRTTTTTTTTPKPTTTTQKIPRHFGFRKIKPNSPPIPRPPPTRIPIANTQATGVKTKSKSMLNEYNNKALEPSPWIQDGAQARAGTQGFNNVAGNNNQQQYRNANSQLSSASSVQTVNTVQINNNGMRTQTEKPIKSNSWQTSGSTFRTSSLDHQTIATVNTDAQGALKSNVASYDATGQSSNKLLPKNDINFDYGMQTMDSPNNMRSSSSSNAWNSGTGSQKPSYKTEPNKNQNSVHNMRNEQSRYGLDTIGATKHSEQSRYGLDTIGAKKHSELSGYGLDTIGAKKHSEQSRYGLDTIGVKKHSEQSRYGLNTIGAKKHSEPSGYGLDTIGAKKHSDQSRYGFDTIGAKKHSEQSYLEPKLSTVDRISVQDKNYRSDKTSVGSGIYSTNTQGDFARVSSTALGGNNLNMRPKLTKVNQIPAMNSKYVPTSGTVSGSYLNNNYNEKSYDRSGIKDINTYSLSSHLPDSKQTISQSSNNKPFEGTVNAGSQTYETLLPKQQVHDQLILQGRQNFGQTPGIKNSLSNAERTHFQNTISKPGVGSSSNANQKYSMDFSGQSMIDISYVSGINKGGQNSYKGKNLSNTKQDLFSSQNSNIMLNDGSSTKMNINYLADSRKQSLDGTSSYTPAVKVEPANDPSKTKFINSHRSLGDINGRGRELHSPNANLKPTFSPLTTASRGISTGEITSGTSVYGGNESTAPKSMNNDLGKSGTLSNNNALPKLDRSSLQELKIRLQLEKLIRKRLTNTLTPADKIKLIELKQEYQVWKQQKQDTKKETIGLKQSQISQSSQSLHLSKDGSEAKIQQNAMNSRQHTQLVDENKWTNVKALKQVNNLDMQQHENQNYQAKHTYGNNDIINSPSFLNGKQIKPLSAHFNAEQNKLNSNIQLINQNGAKSFDLQSDNYNPGAQTSNSGTTNNEAQSFNGQRDTADNGAHKFNGQGGNANKAIQSFIGQRRITNNGDHSFDGLQADINSRTQSFNGQSGSSDQGTQSFNGQIVNTNNGAQTFNGQIVNNNNGAQTLTGQRLNTDNGAHTLTGQRFNTNNDVQTFNGQRLNTDNSAQTFNGQRLNTDNIAQTFNGQIVSTNNAAQTSTGQRLNTDNIAHTLNGQRVNTNNAAQTLNGHILNTDNGGRTLNGQRVNTNNGALKLNEQVVNINNDVQSFTGQKGDVNIDVSSFGEQKGNTNILGQSFHGKRVNTGSLSNGFSTKDESSHNRQMDYSDNFAQSNNGQIQNTNNDVQSLHGNWEMSKSGQSSAINKDNVDYEAPSSTSQIVNSNNDLNILNVQNGNSDSGSHSSVKQGRSGNHQPHGSSGLSVDSGTGYTHTTIGPAKTCSITPVCGTDGFTYMSDCFLWPGVEKGCDGFCPCDKSSSPTTSPPTPVRPSKLEIPKSIPPLQPKRPQPTISYIKPTVPSEQPPVQDVKPRCNCPELYRPVCGLKGTTYENDCVRRCNYDGFKCQGKCPCDANSPNYQADTMVDARPDIQNNKMKVPITLEHSPSYLHRKPAVKNDSKINVRDKFSKRPNGLNKSRNSRVNAASRSSNTGLKRGIASNQIRQNKNNLNRLSANSQHGRITTRTQTTSNVVNGNTRVSSQTASSSRGMTANKGFTPTVHVQTRIVKGPRPRKLKNYASSKTEHEANSRRTNHVVNQATNAKTSSWYAKGNQDNRPMNKGIIKPTKGGQGGQGVNQMSGSRMEHNAERNVGNDISVPCYCSDVYAPVCGSDGVTYQNPCRLSCSAGVETSCTGECPCTTYTTQPTYYCEDYCGTTYEPVCSVTGRTFGNECLRRCSVQSKECNGECPCYQVADTMQPQNIDSIYTSSDVYVAPTPSSSGWPVDPNNFNAEPSNQPLSTCECQAGDIDPVCTTSGETIMNGCEAICLGATIACSSECPC